MPSRSRFVNALAAMCALTLVAGVLSLFAHQSHAAPASVRLSMAPPSHPTVPATGAPVPTTGSTTTLPNATSTTIATTTGATTAPAGSTATTAPVAPATTRPPVAVPNQRWAVGTESFALIDTSRSTPPAGSAPGQASRSLPTVIRYPVEGPAGDAEVAGGAGSHTGAPFPLIVFAHGYDSSPGAYAALQHAWASAGYVVAAPSFPRGTAGGPLDENDLNNQPRDLSFVITNVLGLAGAGGPLAGLVDRAHIGVAGHSDGASTTAGLGYNTCCRDGRVIADAVMEGDKHDFPGGSWFPSGAAPALLLIQADHDALNPPALGQAVYNGARSPKYLLWLINAQHLEPYTTDAAHLSVVEAVTTAFFDRYLKGRPDAVAQMRRGATRGLATLAAG